MHLKEELKKIKWLSFENTCKQTLYVSGIILISSVLIGGFDTLIKYIISLFI